MKIYLSGALAFSALVLTACDRDPVVVETRPVIPETAPLPKTKTLETERLGGAVDRFHREPTAEHLAQANKALAELDAEIADLDSYIATHSGAERADATAKRQNLVAYRDSEKLRLAGVQGKTPLPPTTPADSRSGAEKVEDAARRSGRALEGAAREVKDAIKDAVR